MSRKDSREWTCDKCGAKSVTNKDPCDVYFAPPGGWDYICGLGDLCADCVKQWKIYQKEYLNGNKPEKKSKKWWK